MAKYECTVCGYIYDEEAEGVPWDQLPDDWLCPDCDSDKSYFELKVDEPAAPAKPEEPVTEVIVKRLVICSVCGYIMQEGDLHEECPACGVSKKVFKPYEDRVKKKRRKFLDLHIHNIIVHFPQAFSVFMLFLLGAVYVVKDPLKAEFLVTAKVLAIFLPLSVLAGLVTGLIDGKTRFKRLNTIILKRKMIVGAVFLLCSAAAVFVLHAADFKSSSHLISLALVAVCSGASVFLGHNGGRMAGTEVPG
jgi:rubredoxin